VGVGKGCKYAQMGHRVPTGDRIDQGFQGVQEVWIMHAQGLASSSSTAQLFGRSLRTGRSVREGKFLQACPNGDPREPGRLGHAAYASSSHRASF